MGAQEIFQQVHLDSARNEYNPRDCNGESFDDMFESCDVDFSSEVEGCLEEFGGIEKFKNHFETLRPTMPLLTVEQYIKRGVHIGVNGELLTTVPQFHARPLAAAPNPAMDFGFPSTFGGSSTNLMEVVDQFLLNFDTSTQPQTTELPGGYNVGDTVYSLVKDGFESVDLEVGMVGRVMGDDGDKKRLLVDFEAATLPGGSMWGLFPNEISRQKPENGGNEDGGGSRNDFECEEAPATDEAPTKKRARRDEEVPAHSPAVGPPPAITGKRKVFRGKRRAKKFSGKKEDDI